MSPPPPNVEFCPESWEFLLVGVDSSPDSPHHVCVEMLLGSFVNKRIGYIIEL